MVPPMDLDRRQFLRGAAALSVVQVLQLAQLRPSVAASGIPSRALEYRDFRDVYRKQWTWDRIAIGTHTCTNCVSGGCAWDLYVRDGMVWREEQGAPYTQTRPDLPDYNPRGCQKGAATSALMRSATRLHYPLKRAGERGENRWKRISWDEALDTIAEATVDTLATRGGAGAYVECGSNFSFSPSTIAMNRLFGYLGVPITNTFGSIGDLGNGATEVLGIPETGGSSDGWFETDYFVNWFCNPVVTRIPDAHFISEVRYRGARVVSISPDYSATAIHADLWITLRPGTDTALALAACRIVIDEGLYDADYIREQTDLPLLVRTDTRRYLTEADVVPGGSPSRQAWWDEATQGIVWSSSSKGTEQATLRLDPSARPSLEVADARVTLANGQTVALRTVFSCLRDRLADYDAESASRITGVSAGTIRRFAREFATAKAAMILNGSSQYKTYHGDLTTRAQILLTSLTGNNGRPGGGWHYMSMFDMEGWPLVSYAEHPSDLSLQRPQGIMDAMMAIIAQQGRTPGWVSGYFLSLLFAGLRDEQLNPAYGDPTLPRTPEQYLSEAIEKGYLPDLLPGEMGNPDLIFNLFGNPFRSCRMGSRRADTLYAKAGLVVNITLKMDDTSRYSDILLPAAGPYEKFGFKYNTTWPPYLHMSERAVAPLGESKSEWDIFWLLAERISAVAQRRGVSEVKGYRGAPYDLTKTAAWFSDGGRLGLADEEKVAAIMIDLSYPTQGITIPKLRENKGAMRYTGVSPNGPGVMWLGTQDYKMDEPVVQFQDMVVRKKPWPTATGRQQFYTDHPWVLELGEELPVHKEPPMAGGNYPLVLSGGHTRWSIHNTWRDFDMMLQLQRGEPVIYVNPDDAKQRGIREHDYAGVFNDLGEFVARAKLTPAIRPGQVLIYHAWGGQQFLTGKAPDDISPSPLKVTRLIGNYGHLVQSWIWEPTQNDRDTRVDMRKYTA